MLFRSFKAEEKLVRPYACEIANKMDPEVWVHHYDLENNRVAPETPPIINFGRPSQDMTGAPSTGYRLVFFTATLS